MSWGPGSRHGSITNAESGLDRALPPARQSVMSGRQVLTRITIGAGLMVAGLALSCLWGLGAFQLALRSHPTGFGANWLVGLLWVAMSLFIFVLATGGIAVLIAYGVDRGRPGIWITLAIGAVLVGLVTWGYVAATDAAMIRYDNSAPAQHPSENHP